MGGSPSSGTLTGVLFATAPGGPSGAPAAALDWADTTLLARLAQQLVSLNAADLHVVVRAPLPTDALGATVHVSADAAADLRLVAALARRGTGPMVLAGAEIVTQREALAGLLADPRVATGILATGGKIARPYGYRTRTRRGRIVSAASPFHTTADPNKTFLGVLKVAAMDRLRLAELAEDLAALRADPPEGWRRELDVCKAGSWKLAAARIARGLAEREARLAEPEAADEPDDEPEVRDGEPSGAPGAVQAAEDAFDRQDPANVALDEEDAEELRRRLAAAPEEIPALLLVALVRDGVQVGSSYLRSLFWARPLSRDGVLRARERIALHDEEEELLRVAVKASDGFFTTFFVSPYSRYVARWCARRGLRPNQVTVFSMLLGLVAAALFATGERPGLVAGAVVAYLAFVFDCVDGQLARYTRTFSKLGAWLDSVFDRAKEYVIFAGLAIGSHHMGHDVWVLAGAALALQTTRHAIDFSYPASQHQAIAAVEHAPLEQPGDGFGLNTPLWLRPPPMPLQEGGAPAPPSARVRVARWWRRIGRQRRVYWAKKTVIFPIGERFAVMALVTALFSPRVTFVVLLSWGSLATTYIVLGRLLRVLRSPTGVAPAGGERGQLELYRDDGPLARALARVGARMPVRPIVLLAAGGLPLLVAIVAGLDSDAAAIVAVAALVVGGGASAGRPHVDRLRWLVPPALRAGELATLLWLATLAGPAAVPAAFGLMSAVCLREYDLVYRFRHQGTTPPPAVNALTLGWDGRVVLALVLLLAGALPTGYWVAGAALAAVVIADAVRSWVIFGRHPSAPVYDDEEEEAE